jgi:hypothetical protein
VAGDIWFVNLRYAEGVWKFGACTNTIPPDLPGMRFFWTIQFSGCGIGARAKSSGAFPRLVRLLKTSLSGWIATVAYDSTSCDCC